MKTTIHTDGMPGWASRARARARTLDAGKPIAASHGITFENAAEMVRLLTPARIDLFQAVREHSISLKELAEQLGRDVSAVRRDVVALERFGIVSSEHVVNPGHGRVRVVSAPARVTIFAEL